MSFPNIKQAHDHGHWLWFDAAIFPDLSASQFEGFLAKQPGEQFGGGRGTVQRFVLNEQRMIHRHYLRGGMMSGLLGDRYLFRQADATRAAREFSLLTNLSAEGLPVPRPVAAHARKMGPWYSADLVTCEILNTHTLAQAVIDNLEIDWSSIGRMIARFHRWGLDHADLNAHNILIDAEGDVYFIDFDRCVRRPKGKWAQGNLQRLHRSLIKIGAEGSIDRFAQSAWRVLRQGYES